MSIEKISANEIKIKNRQLIYQYIRTHKQAPKRDIVADLCLSLPTVTQNLEYLKEQNLIDTSQKVTNTGGRNATAFAYIPDAKIAIGVYITAHQMSAVALNLSGEVIGFVSERAEFALDDDNYLRKLGDLVESVKKEAGEDKPLLGVGIAVPGLVSSDGETVTYGLTLDFTGKKKEEIAKYIPYECRLFHDSSAAGYMEAWTGNKIKNGFYISLNNSVGGAVIIDNILYEGNTQKGGEIGHMTVETQKGKKCYCGKYGCFETVCSTEVLVQHTNGRLDEFFKLLKSADETAILVWNQYLEDLSLAVHNIRMLFDGNVILGGYIGPYIEEYMDNLRRRVDERNPFGDKAENYLMVCHCKTEAAASGAAAYYIERFLDEI